MKKNTEQFYQNFYNINNITNLIEQERIQKELIDPETGFERGNIFKNLYWAYMKDTYDFSPKNDREELMLKIMHYSFYAHELKLYLDTHTRDEERINLFIQYSEMANNLTLQYERLYAPITLKGDNLDVSPWVWAESPWPWEGV